MPWTRLLATALLLSASVWSLAQPRPAPLAPLNPKAPVPAASSPRLLPEPKPPRAAQDWRKANEDVARIGGWRVYSREPAASEVKP